jgi:predicted alpha/beta hydrolase family esterase
MVLDRYAQQIVKQQILIIHGGDAFNTYREYLSFLKNAKISLDDIRPQSDWKDNLSKKLGKKFEVLQPSMPNKKNAKYKEWKIWFEKIIPLLDKEVILIGHSLGGAFLSKYLSENKISNKIIATYLVAAPFVDLNSKWLIDFRLPKSLALFFQQSNKIYLIHSKDDPTVPFADLKRYKESLPNTVTQIFSDRGHFGQETFPEIVKLINAL